MSSSHYLARHAAFFDELEKIATSQPEEKPELKNRIKAIGTMALASGLAFASATALHDHLVKNPSQLWLNMAPEKKYQILGGLKMLATVGTPYVLNKVMEHKKKVEQGKK